MKTMVELQITFSPTIYNRRLREMDIVCEHLKYAVLEDFRNDCFIEYSNFFQGLGKNLTM